MRSRLQLDFVAPRSRSRLAGVVVLAAAVGLAAHLIVKHRDAQDRLRQLDAVEAMVSAPRPARALPRERLDAEMKAAQATVRQLALPWSQLIDSLERSAMREVSVLHVQPDAQQRLLRVTAETRGEELMLEYLRRVGASGFSEAHLVNHQVREDDPQRPLQFSLQASFRKP